MKAKWPGNSGLVRTTFGGYSRSRLMSRIRSTGNATTELKLMRMLREAGISGWRRHYPMKEKPDFVFIRARLAVFVDGCFWHGHGCGRNLSPRTNAKLWRKKIVRNRCRDRLAIASLRQRGWRVLRIWECVLRKNPALVLRRLRRDLA